MDDLVKKEFLRRIITQESADLKKDQELALRKFLQFHTGDTESTRKFSVSVNEEYLSGTITMQGRAHIRFLDIRKKSPRAKSDRINTVRRRYIYNRHVFKTYLRIARRLMFGLTMEVADGIKRELNHS